LTTADDSRIDPAVVEKLYKEHADDLYAFLLGVLRNHDLAREALQATFAKALESGHAARDETRRGWLFRVGYHEAVGLRRRSEAHKRAVQKHAWASPVGPASPLEDASRNEDRRRIRDALDTLPKEQQQVVRMRIYDEKTFAAIAEELQQPLGTVLTRMRLALQKLGKLFKSPHE
jgi:RNA polymerase sigma-70 factor (ECF subfamily)